MTTRWTLTLLALTAAAAFTVGRLSAHRAVAFDPARDFNSAQLSSLLNLTEAQAAEVDKLNGAYAQQVREACDAHCANRCQLGEALRRDTLTHADARALMERMCASQQENEMATLEHILSVRAILTPDQRALFAQAIGNCLCSTCEADKSSCCANPNPKTETKP